VARNVEQDQAVAPPEPDIYQVRPSPGTTAHAALCGERRPASCDQSTVSVAFMFE
jgi:hypothetical protein